MKTSRSPLSRDSIASVQFEARFLASTPRQSLKDTTHPTTASNTTLNTAGQGPYTGQAIWFARFHPKKIPSATNRFTNEIVRIISVLDKHLATNNTDYLVGNKCTYADLSFVTWAGLARGLLKELGREDEYQKFPRYEARMGRLERREVVKGVAEIVAEGRRKHGLP